MTEPGAAGGWGQHVRVSHVDREQSVEVLKTAFVQGRLTKDELDARVGQALASRTRAELAVLTADIPPARAASGLSRPLVPARRRPLARVAVGSGGCLALAAAALWASFILDPGGPGADRSWAGLMLQLALFAGVAGVCILWSGLTALTTSAQQRRSGRQLPAPFRCLSGLARWVVPGLAGGEQAGGLVRTPGAAGVGVDGDDVADHGVDDAPGGLDGALVGEQPALAG